MTTARRAASPATLTVPLDGQGQLDDGTLASADAPTAHGKTAAPQQQQSTPLPLAKPVPTPHVSKDGRVGGDELADSKCKARRTFSRRSRVRPACRT